MERVSGDVAGLLRKTRCRTPGYAGFGRESVLLGRSGRAATFAALFPDARFESALPEVEAQKPTREDALLACVTGWMAHAGPITSTALSAFLGIAATTSRRYFCGSRAAVRFCAEASPVMRERKQNGATGVCWREFIG